MWLRWIGIWAVLHVFVGGISSNRDETTNGSSPGTTSSSITLKINVTEATSEQTINLKPEYRHPKGIEIFDPYNTNHKLGNIPESDDEEDEEGEEEGELDGEDYFYENGRKYEQKNYEESKEDGEADLLPLGGEPLLHGSDNLPYFLVEPQNSYVVKSKPATLNCRAANALQVFFSCNGEKASSSSQFEFVDPHSGVRVIEAEYNVTYNDVEEYFGKDRFKCECFAWASRGQIPSRPAYVEIAYIKKQFSSAPHSVSASINGQVTLRCKPPAAAPAAKISWIKDGLLLNAGETISINEDGTIKFSKISQQDAGNYSCVAENIAGRRTSEPAILNIYEDNGWSSWSTWTPCRCGSGKRRTRTCNTPPCAGTSVQRSGDCSCHTGDSNRWGSWSAWSACGSDCMRSRRRVCLSHSCSGKEIQHAACLGGYCLLTGDQDPRSGDQGTRNDLPLYIGMALSLTVFAGVTLAVFILVKKKKRGIYLRARTDRKSDIYPDSEKALAPDLMQHTRNGERHAPAYTRTPPTSEHYYDVPQINTTYSSPAERQTASCMSTESDEYEHKPYNGSGHSVSSGITSSGSTYSAVTEQVALAGALATLVGESDWSAVGDSGGEGSGDARLWLPAPRVRLALSHGALPRRSRLHLAVLRDTRPHLPKGIIQLSPVIKSGPIDITLSKPAIIEVPHSANIEKGYWSFSVYTTDRGAPKTSRAYWRKIVDVGHETIDTPVYSHIDSDRAFLVVDFLSTFVLAGESLSGKAVKNIQMALFGPPLNIESKEYTVKVFVLDNTPCALLQCTERERKLGAILLDEPKQLPFRDGGSSLCISLEDVGYGWKSKAGEAFRDIGFDHIWSSSCAGIGCTLTLERKESHEILEFTVAVQQKNDPSHRKLANVIINETGIRIIENPFETRSNRSREGSNRSTPLRRCKLDDEEWRYPRRGDNSSTPSRSIKSDIPEEERRLLPRHEERVRCLDNEDEEVWRIPNDVMSALCAALDPPGEWAAVARALGLARRPAHWAARTSPTSHVLALWHARNRCDSRAPSVLAHLLRDIGRSDLATLVDHCV